MVLVPAIRPPQEQRLPLPISSYERRRGSTERLVNCFPEQGKTKGDVYLYGTPGMTLKGTFDRHPQRGAANFGGRLYVAAGNTLYSVLESGTATSHGTIPGAGPVTMVENGASLVVITNENLAYAWNNTTLSPISDADFTSRGASDGAFVGNYLLFIEPGSGRFFGSELGSATDYDALDFATAESNTDDLIGITEDHGDVFLAGTESCELWGNVGGSGFPFSRRFNGFIEQGCAAQRSIVNADQTVFWLDDTRIIRRLNGVTPVRVSTHGVETAWESYSTVSDAEGFTYTQRGHIFVGWTFPTAQKTWVYDVTTKQWFERESYNQGFWRPSWVVNVYGGVWAGDRNSGKFGVLDSSGNFNEFGDPQVMRWTYPSVYAERATAFHHELELVCETGVGLSGSDSPEVMMQVSDDGGRTFDFLETANIGKIGEYRTIVTWNGLGSAEDRVYKGSISDNSSERAIYQTHLRVTGGTF